MICNLTNSLSYEYKQMESSWLCFITVMGLWCTIGSRTKVKLSKANSIELLSKVQPSLWPSFTTWVLFASSPSPSKNSVFALPSCEVTETIHDEQDLQCPSINLIECVSSLDPSPPLIARIISGQLISTNWTGIPNPKPRPNTVTMIPMSTW